MMNSYITQKSSLLIFYKSIYQCHIILILALFINEMIVCIKVSIRYFYKIIFLYLILCNINDIFSALWAHFYGYIYYYFYNYKNYYNWSEVSLLITPKFLSLMFLGYNYHGKKNDWAFQSSKLKQLNSRNIVFHIIRMIFRAFSFIIL